MPETEPSPSNASEVEALREQLAQRERDLSEVIAREASLQTDLAAAQRRGVAAQRLLDEARSSATGNAAETRRVAVLQSALDDAEAARAFAEQKHRTALGEAARREDTLRNDVATLEGQVKEALAAMNAAVAESGRHAAALAELKAAAAEPDSPIYARAAAEAELGLVNVRTALAEKDTEVAALTKENEKVKKSYEQAARDAEQLRKEVHRAGLQAEIVSRRHTTEVEKERAALHAAELEHAEEVAALTARYEQQLDELAERAIEETNAAMQSLERTVAAQAEELEALKARAQQHATQAHGLEQESAWLQGELAKTRKDARAARDAEAAARDEAAKLSGDRDELKASVKGLKKANHRLLCDLRGDGGMGLIPLPDHRKLGKREIVDLLVGTTGTCAQLLGALEALPDGAELGSKEEDELAFAAALAKKIAVMVPLVTGEDEHPVYIAKRQQLELRVEMVREKFDL
eukprot:TRINITY_DN32271_c0_g1_i1.p1 TRINITY_DN32271_c0_g1~~TRINITY_DN32271_c0_g1_i1.p1  ORF type:complete len:465 (+),score=168.78 TRINITY_DN32271_c0_g1_i1:135-1529(+)